MNVATPSGIVNNMPALQQDIRDTAVQFVKALECPICLEILRDPLSTSCHHRFCRLCLEQALQDNYKIPCPLCKAVVTKRSLTQSDLIVKLVDKVKQLVQAVKSDCGVEVTPRRGQLEPANAPLERHFVHSSAQKAATSCKNSLNLSSRATNKRAFVVHTDADIGAANKKPRSTATAVHDKPTLSKDSESHGSVSSRRSNKSLQETKENSSAETKQIYATRAKSSMVSASSTAENMSMASSRQELRSNSSEAPMEVEMQSYEASASRHLQDSSENHAEKVQDWLQKCDSVPQKNTPSGLERSEAQESCSGPAEKQLGSNRFFTSANQACIVSGKRNSVLDVSDTDPYKFIPSQKSLQAVRRGKRRLRGNGRAAGLGAKRLSRRKSDQQKSVCEFENLRDLYAEEKAQEEDDARELEIELFVTPGVRPCVEKKVINQRRSLTTTRRRSRKIKSNLQLKPLEEQVAELQKNISEAEGHELVIANALPGNMVSKRAEHIRNTSALKDVSNLKAQAENKVQNVVISALSMSSSEEENLPQQLSSGVDKPMSCQREKTDAVLHSKTSAEPVKEKGIVDLCFDDEGGVGAAAEKCKGTPQEGVLGDVIPGGKFACNDAQENATLSRGSPADAPSDLGSKGAKPSDSTLEERCQENSQSEEQSCGHRPLSLKDFEGFFKKSSRKTFDINASTQDLESLGSGAVDTLELMTDVCNSLKQVQASEPDLAPVYEEPGSMMVPTNHGANHQVSVPHEGDTLLPCKTSRVDQYSPCSSDSIHKSKDHQHSPSTTSCPASTIVPAVEPAVKDGSCHTCHVTNANVACPACNAQLSLVCGDGVIKVVLKGQPQRPVLIETGMCTERPFTKVIICREATTQTESSDSKELEPGSCGDSCSNLPSPHLPVAAPDAVQAQTAMIDSGASDKVLNGQTKYSHISNTSIYIDASSACGGLQGEPVTHGHAKLAKPTVENAVLKRREEILDLDYINEKLRSTEVLCENTEDQGVLPSRPNLFRASQFGLRTIVEDTEEMDTTPPIKSKEIDTLQSSPLQHEDSASKCDGVEKREIQSEAQCSAETSLLQSQNEAFLRREGTKLSDLGSKCPESSPTSCHTKRVLPQYKQSTGFSSQADQMETYSNDRDPCSREACFQSQKGRQHSMQEERDDPNTPPKENTCHHLAEAPASHLPDVTNATLPGATCDQDMSSSVTPSFATANDESEVQKASSPHAHINRSPEKVATSDKPEAVSPNQDGSHTSAESSPWSSPILIRRVAPRSAQNKAKKALMSSDTTSRGDDTDSCEVIEAPSKAGLGRKSSRQILPSVAADSDSDSDPVTESEAQELLRHAVLEGDSEEAAVIFAKRAVAPLEACKKPRVPQLQASKRSVWSPEKCHSTLRPTQKVGTSSQGKHHSLWKKHDSSVNDGDNSENTGGRSLATTLSSTLSEGLDRTLKEKMLEQDIADMKKQMMMLENELQKTTAGKGRNDNPNNDSAANNTVVAMNGKDDNWDWDDSDGPDEVVDFVPPTPPRKSRSSGDESYCSTTK